jgi:hypothetical protein
MTGNVLTEFTREVNMRHLFVPQEVVPRTMAGTMQAFDWNNNPVSHHFCVCLTKIAECMTFG